MIWKTKGFILGLCFICLCVMVASTIDGCSSGSLEDRIMEVKRLELIREKARETMELHRAEKNKLADRVRQSIKPMESLSGKQLGLGFQIFMCEEQYKKNGVLTGPCKNLPNLEKRMAELEKEYKRLSSVQRNFSQQMDEAFNNWVKTKAVYDSISILHENAISLLEK